MMNYGTWAAKFIINSICEIKLKTENWKKTVKFAKAFATLFKNFMAPMTKFPLVGWLANAFKSAANSFENGMTTLEKKIIDKFGNNPIWKAWENNYICYGYKGVKILMFAAYTVIYSGVAIEKKKASNGGFVQIEDYKVLSSKLENKLVKN